MYGELVQENEECGRIETENGESGRIERVWVIQRYHVHYTLKRKSQGNL
jgi:hypothetical protein